MDKAGKGERVGTIETLMRIKRTKGDARKGALKMSSIWRTRKWTIAAQRRAAAWPRNDRADNMEAAAENSRVKIEMRLKNNRVGKWDATTMEHESTGREGGLTYENGLNEDTKRMTYKNGQNEDTGRMTSTSEKCKKYEVNVTTNRGSEPL